MKLKDSFHLNSLAKYFIHKQIIYIFLGYTLFHSLLFLFFRTIMDSVLLEFLWKMFNAQSRVNTSVYKSLLNIREKVLFFFSFVVFFWSGLIIFNSEMTFTYDSLNYDALTFSSQIMAPLDVRFFYLPTDWIKAYL